VRDASHAASGLATGLARCAAPRARLANYKACHAVGLGRTSCGDTSILAALDAAIGDGVDVLSLSLGGINETPEMLDDVAAGITVVLAAGNEGPVQQTVQNALPWAITVAGATVDRSFPTVITLGDGQKLVVRTPTQALVVIIYYAKAESLAGSIIVLPQPLSGIQEQRRL
jgi:subtilisin family serine protease